MTPPLNPATGQAIRLMSDHRRKVWRLLAHGYETKEIAVEMDIALSTACQHVARIVDALGVRTKTEAALLYHGVVVDKHSISCRHHTTATSSSDLMPCVCERGK